MSGSQADGLQVTTADLVAHAASVDDVADRMGLGRSAAAGVRLGRDAYGQLCQLIPALLDPIQSSGVDALAASVDALRETAEALRLTAGDYRTVDTGVSGRFDGILAP
ncbi:type VII secretion target [Micromonospora sp. NPDC049559]|uniref:type VII secretion target n=1 Tax=Micromonospora sp. NPDC049559 TaxID=3155923 RepID=UPI0034171637